MMVNLLGEDGVFALLLDLICPSNIERHVLFILLEHEHLAAALGWKEALVLRSALEEAGNIIRANPVLTAGSCNEQFAILLLAAADHAALLRLSHVVY